MHDDAPDTQPPAAEVGRAQTADDRIKEVVHEVTHTIAEAMNRLEAAFKAELASQRKDIDDVKTEIENLRSRVGHLEGKLR